MRFSNDKQYLTGTAVPVSALHSEESCGIGEFADIPAFGRFCKNCGLDLVQILPVNDTGYQSSPYSALSAFALHPVYMRLQQLPGSDSVNNDIDLLKKEHKKSLQVKFYQTVRKKIALLRKIYNHNAAAGNMESDLEKWISKNDWIRIYAVYSHLKENHGHEPWYQWKTMDRPTQEEIATYWTEHKKEVQFFAWCQYHLERQLMAAAVELNDMGIALKGDLPILMNRDSADVWAHPRLFNSAMQAGAPPDFYTDHGQNWGFPVYEWDEHKADGFSWWKARIAQADKFYHAYRIDHVLGFFRIWATPDFEDSASMGHYIPYTYVNKKDLLKEGFSEERIAWMSKPHIYTYEIKNKLGATWEEVLPYLDRIGIEELFIMKKEIRGSRDIEALTLSRTAKDAMIEWSRNVLLIPVKKDAYFPSWHLRRSRAYDSINHEEKEKLESILENQARKSEKNWAKLGETLLGIMKEKNSMLVCAEDLGVVPDCVPKVLDKLKILGLRICYWAKEYKKQGEPYIPISGYPFRTVCALSVHDTGSFREWWLKTDNEEKAQFCVQSLQLEENPDFNTYTEETASVILGSVMKTSSKLCVLQIQDLLAVKASYCPEKPEEERINAPGTVNDINWSYKMIPSTAVLSADTGLAKKLHNLVLYGRPL